MFELIVFLAILYLAAVSLLSLRDQLFFSYRKRRVQKKRDAILEEEHYLEDTHLQLMRSRPIHAVAISYKCYGHPNRTLALRYGILNQGKSTSEGVYEKRTINLIKKGFVKGFEDRGHYWAELVDYGNARVRVVIDDGADFINTFYPINDREWFDKYEPLERILKNAEAFTLKELAKYHLDLVVIPSLKDRGTEGEQKSSNVKSI